MLAQAIPATSTGELCNLFDWAHRQKKCSCGEMLHACELWAPVLNRVIKQTGFSLAQLDQITRGAEHNRRSDPLEWTVVWSACLSALRDVHGIGALIDSSKTSGGQRRMALMTALPACRVALAVHIARSLSGVIYSLRQGSNRRLEDGGDPTIRLATMKAIYGWLIANGAATRQAHLAENAVSVRYEDLPRQIHLVQEAALEALGDLENPVYPGHAIAGNRMFRDMRVSQVRIDDKAPLNLSRRSRVLAVSVERGAISRGIVPERMSSCSDATPSQ